MTGGRGSSFRDDVRALLRERALDVAREITTGEGWSAVTMAAVARRVGVSRQHLHNELGTKQDLGNAMVDRETDEFLALMQEQLRAHPRDLCAGIEAATRGALVHGAHNTLLKSIVAVGESRGDSLLPLLTARPDAVLARAKDAFAAEIHSLHPDLGRPRRKSDQLVDACIRLILSHLTQPSGSIDEAAEQVRWLTSGMLESR